MKVIEKVIQLQNSLGWGGGGERKVSCRVVEAVNWG